jgi:dihydroorotase
MKILIKSAQIIEKESAKNKFNVLIEDGVISRITDQIPTADIVIEGNSLGVSQGWVDFGAFMADPGFEYKEDLQSGTFSAMHGGFTEVVCLPNTNPVIQDKNSINYYTSGNSRRLVQLLPLGSVTINNAGVDLTEMLDMHEAGAVAFSDGFKSINNADIILKSLQYLSKINSLLINRPNECSLSQTGVAHEGIISTMLGLKGIPALAEEIAILRDLKLLEYAGGKIHFSNISTAGSVDLIRKAKQDGFQVTCDIAAHQIAFDDSSLKGFDTNYKVNPPFRSQKDIEAIWKGLKDGTIDVITSSHSPQDEESKKLEFDLADFGIIGLETAFSVANTFNKSLSVNELIEKFTTNPRKILGRKDPFIKEGEIANLTVFDAEGDWIYTDKGIKSKSKNSPFVNVALKGRPVGVFNNKYHFVNEALLNPRVSR